MNKVSIKDHCEITSSKRIFASEYSESGIPFYRGREISEKHNSSSGVTDLIYISREKYNEIKAKYGVPQKGDLLLTSVGTIGNPYLVKDNNEFYFKDGNLTWFKNFKGMDSKWFYYWLLSPQGKSELNKCTIGSSQKAYTINLLYRLQLDLPSFESQINISSTISNYDDLIENNEKRIKILEEMAQRLYTEWFVKFRFPGHEKINMIDSGTDFGIIPDGWKVKTLGETIKYVRGKSYSSEQISDTNGDYYLVNLKSFNRGGGFRFDGDKYYSGPINNNQLLVNGDIVVAVTDMTPDRAVIARPARIPKINFPKITLSADAVKIVTSNLPLTFVYQVLSDYRFTQATKNKANGANVLHLKPDAILEYSLVVPDQNTLNLFDKLCSNVFSEVDCLIATNQRLVEMRDLLIPQLITGRIELKN